MKGQSHLTISQDPLPWNLAPPAMYGECGAEVLDAVPVDTFTVSFGRLPDFDPLKTCGKCIARVTAKDSSNTDEHGNTAPFYVYAIANRKDAQQEHSGNTITSLEDTVKRVSGG